MPPTSDLFESNISIDFYFDFLKWNICEEKLLK